MPTALASGTDVLIERFVAEREQKENLIQTYAEQAATEQRDLNESERETIAAARSRLAAIDEQIQTIGGRLEMDEGVRDSIRRISPTVRDSFEYKRAGDLLFDMLHQDDEDARARYQRFTRSYAGTRAAEHMGLDKANTVPVAGGFNGLVVAPVVGPVLDPSPQGRPLFTALGARSVSTASFLRPRIVDPNFDTGVAPQGKEKQELVSKAWDILSDPVKLTVIGGYINVSMLLEEMLAGSLDMVVSHMNTRLEHDTEVAVLDEIAKSGASVPLADASDPAAVQKAIAQAAALVYKNTQRPATWIAMGVDGWANLMGLSDLAGRPMFPALNASNALGQGGANTVPMSSVMGLQTILTYALSGADYFVGNSYGIEVYERPLPLMQVLEPSVRGRQISVASAVGFYRPVTTESPDGGVTPAQANGVVKVTVSAGP